MKRVSKELLKELTDLFAEGHSIEQVASAMNEKGSVTPNGFKWTHANVSYYKTNYRLGKRAKLSNSMRARHASGEMDKYKSDQGSIEKIRLILSLNLSRETTSQAIQEVL